MSTHQRRRRLATFASACLMASASIIPAANALEIGGDDPVDVPTPTPSATSTPAPAPTSTTTPAPTPNEPVVDDGTITQVIDGVTVQSLYRINAGGPAVGDWAADNQANRSPYVTGAGNQYSSTNRTVSRHSSVPSTAPSAIFKTERFDTTRATPLGYDFPVANGTHTVRLYFAEIFNGGQEVGFRRFNVLVEGNRVLRYHDTYAEVGGYRGVMYAFSVDVTDGTLNVDLMAKDGAVRIQGIEILTPATPESIPAPNLPDVDPNPPAPAPVPSPTETSGTDTVDDTVDDTTDVVDDTVSDTTDTVDDTVDDTTDVVDEVVDTGTDTANDTTDTVTDTAGDVTDTAGDVVDDTVDTVTDTTNEVPNTVNDVTDTVTDVVDDATDAATEAVDDVIDTVDDTVGDVTDSTLGVGDVITQVIDGVEIRSLYRVNSGGPIVGTWSADNASSPSPFVTGVANEFASTANSIRNHGSIPAGTPMAIFQTERFDSTPGTPMGYDFPVANGTYTVRLYQAEIFAGGQRRGFRTYNVLIEDRRVLRFYDTFADVGGYRGVVQAFHVDVTDGTLNVDIIGKTNTARIMGIEVLAPITPDAIAAPNLPDLPDVGDVVDDVTDTVDDVIDTVDGGVLGGGPTLDPEETVTGLITGLVGSGDDLLDEFGNPIDDITDTVGDLVDGADGVVDDLIGGEDPSDEPTDNDDNGEPGDPTPTPSSSPTPTPTPSSPPNPDPPPSPNNTEFDVRITVGQKWQTVIDRNPPGTTYLISRGVHRNQSVVPKDGDTIIGESGAIMSGAKNLSANNVTWQKQGKLWFVDGQKQQGWCSPQHTLEPNGNPRDLCPEMFFADDQVWEHVAKGSLDRAGEWHFDYNADRIYIATDPARAGKLETASTPYAIYGEYVSNVTVDNLIIEKYAVRSSHGPLHAHNAPNWTFRNITARWNHGAGITHGPGTQISNVLVHHNGQIGITGAGAFRQGPRKGETVPRPVVVRDSELHHNRILDYKWGWEGGGTKFAETEEMIFENNWSHHNYGPGVWWDVYNNGAIIRNNLIENNTVRGIMYELSFGPTKIYNNISRNNGKGVKPAYKGSQIYVSSSDVVEVWNNTISGGERGIVIRHDGTRTPKPKNVQVHDNDIIISGWSGFTQENGEIRENWTNGNIRYRNNTWRTGNPDGRFWYWNNSTIKWDDWKRTVNANGSTVTNSSVQRVWSTYHSTPSGAA